MPSFSLATSRIRRFLAVCEISMSDFGFGCCEAGMRDDPSIERETGGRDAGNVAGQVNLAFAAIFADFAHSPASIFLPSAGWTRVTLKRPSAHTTVNPSASTAA